MDEQQVQVVELQVFQGLDAGFTHVFLPFAVVPQLAGDLHPKKKEIKPEERER